MESDTAPLLITDYNLETEVSPSVEDLNQGFGPYRIYLSIILLIILLGNIFVIYAIMKRKNLKVIENSYLISLSIGFILEALLVLPPYILHDEWTYGDEFCSIWTQLKVFFLHLTPLHLCVILLDRYLAIHIHKGPFAHRSKCVVTCTIVAVWILSILLSVPPLFIWRYKHHLIEIGFNKFCNVSEGEYIFNIYTCMSMFVLATIYMIIMLILTMKAYLSDDAASHLHVKEDSDSGNNFARWYAGRVMVEMVASVCILWIILETLRALPVALIDNLVVKTFNFIAKMHFLEMATPVIYVILNREFKKAICYKK